MPDQPKPTSPPPPGNAFTTEFLERLRRRDEPTGAAEADLAGPWRIEPTAAGFSLFRGWESAGRGDLPFARFRRREDALLFFAVLPGHAREPVYTLRTEAGPSGYAIEGGGEALGSLHTFDPDLVSASATAATLVRSPLCLAALLEAAGSFALDAAGDLLGRQGLARIVGV